MVAYNKGKFNLVVMKAADDPYSSDASLKPHRKETYKVGAIDAGIELEQETGNGEVKLSPRPADMPRPARRPLPLTLHSGHVLSAISEHPEARRSVVHLSIVASVCEHPVTTLAT